MDVIEWLMECSHYQLQWWATGSLAVDKSTNHATECCVSIRCTYTTLKTGAMNMPVRSFATTAARDFFPRPAVGHFVSSGTVTRRSTHTPHGNGVTNHQSEKLMYFLEYTWWHGPITLLYLSSSCRKSGKRPETFFSVCSLLVRGSSVPWGSIIWRR